MVIEYIGQLIRNEVAEMREKIYEKQVITDLQLATAFYLTYVQRRRQSKHLNFIMPFVYDYTLSYLVTVLSSVLI